MNNEKFTWKDLKNLVDQMDEKQLASEVPIFLNDEEEGHTIDCAEVSDEDMYWMDGDCYGNELSAKDTITSEQWEEEKENFLIIPKGTVTLHYSTVEI